MTSRLVIPTAFLVALSVSASPALAQHRGNGGSRGSAAGRSYPVASRGVGPARVAPRVVVASRNFYYRPSYVRTGYRPYYYSRPFYRPYYSFRPRISLGIGLWLGYPVAYPSYYYGYPSGYGYPYDYGYSYPSYSYGYGYPAPPPAYGYPAPGPSAAYPTGNYSSYPAPQASGSMTVQPGGQQSATGGVSLEVAPGTASVFVDGTYMGTGADFGPSSRPLGLTTGRHRVEVRADGYQSMSFDADVRAGQVLPYQATLQRR
jgi:hypothetical protein